MIQNYAQWIPDVVEQILQVAAQFNESLFPFSIIIPVLFAAITLILLYYCYKEPGKKSSNYLKAFLAIISLYSGLTISVGVDTIGFLFSLVGLLGMWFVSGLLLLDIYWNKTIFEFSFDSYKDARILGIELMVTGVFIYPVAEILTGHIWPEMVLFGAKCPTTIFLIGLFIAATPKSNKLLFAIVSLNAIYTGGSVAIAGFPTDFLYAAAGIIGLIILIKYWKAIKFFPLKENRS